MTSRVAVAAASFLLVLLPLLEVACGGSADEGNAPRTRSSQGPPTWFSGGVPGKRVQADTLVAEMARASGVDPEEIHEVVQAREGREAYVLLAAPRKDGEICLSQAAVTGSRFFMVGDFSCAPTALAPVTRFADQAMLVWQSGGGERPTVQSSMAIVGLARSDVTRRSGRTRGTSEGAWPQRVARIRVRGPLARAVPSRAAGLQRIRCAPRLRPDLDFSALRRESGAVSVAISPGRSLHQGKRPVATLSSRPAAPPRLSSIDYWRGRLNLKTCLPAASIGAFVVAQLYAASGKAAPCEGPSRRATDVKSGLSNWR